MNRFFSIIILNKYIVLRKFLYGLIYLNINKIKINKRGFVFRLFKKIEKN